MGLDPEQTGLTGCWQFVAVWRDRQELRRGKVTEESSEYSFYASSLAAQETSAQGLARLIRDHWGACENGAHYRRDVTLGEDASQISGRRAAHAMATLRNLVLGLFELRKNQAKTDAPYLPGWQRRMTASAALQLIKPRR